MAYPRQFREQCCMSSARRCKARLTGYQGALETWLLLRSLRTFSLRILTQSRNATELATWLNQVARTPRGRSFDGAPGGVIKSVSHGSFQENSTFDPAKQHTGGYSPTFAIMVGGLWALAFRFL